MTDSTFTGLEALHNNFVQFNPLKSAIMPKIVPAQVNNLALAPST
jgi:hypothetical protein